MTALGRRGITTRPPRVTPLRATAALVATLGFLVMGGWIEFIVAAAIAAAVLVLSPPYWFVLGQIAAIGLFTDATGLPLLVIHGSLLVGFAIATASETDLQTGVMLMIGTGLCLAVAGGVYSLWETVWGTVASLGVVVALMLYVVYRYEQVRLGLVTEAS